ncbi:MAG: ATPase [Prolixibacteraceae bacterium]|nr:ATPase [Prolixibacteraceae bacterium]
MILIADSGSTKTTWCLINKKGSPAFFSTSGINPFFRTSDDIVDELKSSLIPKLNYSRIEKIYFYGAGIINDAKKNVIRAALKQLFPATFIEINSDLLAAAHATLGNNKGITCILGTGSNSGLYDGNSIIEHIPPLGFILGDEGSGAVLGKKLIADYLKGVMPENLSKQFKMQYNSPYPVFMESVYKKEKPNQYLAQFVPFINMNISEIYCNKLVENSFVEFVERNISQYTNYNSHKICFVGSVAYHFQDQLKNVFKKQHLQLGEIEKDPINGLLRFYQNKK